MKNFQTQEYKRIVSFIQNEMEAEEREAFKTELRNDPDKFREVRDVKRMLELADEVFYEGEARALLTKPVIVPLWQRPAVWAAAASTLLVLSIGGWWLFGVKPPKPEIAKIEYHPALQEMARTLIREPLEVADVPEKFSNEREAVDNDMETDKAIASLENFNGKNETTVKSDSGKQLYGGPAETKPEKQGISREDDGYRLLLIGIGYLKHENATKALGVFEAIRFEGLSQDVSWYKALAYLHEGNNVKAREELLQITDERYLEDAKGLLGKLPH